MVLFASIVKAVKSGFTNKRGRKKSSVSASPNCVSLSTKSPQVPTSSNFNFSCNVKFLGLSLVDSWAYEDCAILDIHADKKRGTERVCLTLCPEYVFCTSKKLATSILHMHSTAEVTGFFVHPQKPRVFGYMIPDSESGTAQLLCFRTHKKYSTTGDQVQSAWLKVCQSQCSAQPSPSSSNLEAVTPPTPAEAPPTVSSPSRLPSHSEVTGSQLSGLLTSTPPTPKPRKCMSTEEKVPLPGATKVFPSEAPEPNRPTPSTTELSSPVPPTRGASLNHLPVTEESVCDTVPAECSTSTNPVCADCGDDMNHNHVEEMHLYNQIHHTLQESSLSIRDITGITIHTREPLQPKDEVATSGSENWLLPDRDPPTWLTPDPASIPDHNEINILKELRECSPPYRPLACTGSDDEEAIEGRADNEDRDIQEQVQMVAEFMQNVWSDLMEEGIQELKRMAREIMMTTIAEYARGQATAPGPGLKQNLKEQSSLGSSSSGLQTSDSGTGVGQTKALVPVELSGIASHQQSKNPPRDYASMLYVRHSTKHMHSAAKKQPPKSSTSSKQHMETANKKYSSGMPLNLCPSSSDSQIVRGAHAFKPCLSGYSGMFYQPKPNPSLAGLSDSGEQGQPGEKPVPRRRRKVKFSQNIMVSQ